MICFGNPTSSLGQSRQLRQIFAAISTAYYGVFHFCLTASADMVCGMTSRTAPGYSLVYRSIDHARLRNLCDQLRRTNPQGVAIVPAAGFGLIADFARVTVNLYEQRMRADYEPSLNFTANEAKVAISEARQAIAWFRSCDEEQRRAFLTMLLFRPR